MQISQPPVKFQSVCIEKSQVSAKVYVGKFKLTEPTSIHFTAGQTIMLYVAEGQNRAMSIASPPYEHDAITIAYDVSPMGVGSRWMVNLNIGDPVSFLGPLGIFTLRPSERKKVFVATGTGIAPFRSILLEQIHSGTTQDFTLYWGLRHTEDVFWHEELTSIASAHSNVHYTLTLSRPDERWQGKRGRVTEHIFSEIPDIAARDVYLCGNGDMVEEMRQKLREARVPDDQVYFELFFGKTNKS